MATIRRSLHVLSAVLGLAGSVLAVAEQQQQLQAEKPATEPETRNPFDDDFAGFAKKMLQEWKVPGVAMAVIDGNDIYAEGFGFAELPDTPATPDTIWYGASTTKAFVGATLAQLIASGNYTAQLPLGWTTPMSAVMRDDFVLQDEWATLHVTLDDAVSHRTGLASHDWSSAHLDARGKVVAPRDVVRNLRNLPLSHEPRTTYQYCNLMFVALSHVVETVTGRWLGDVLRELVWAPLNMTATYFSLEDALASPRHFAAGYEWVEGEGRFKEMDKMPLSELAGAGSVISNVVDYAAWVRCLLHEGEPLLPEAHRDLRTPRSISAPEPGNGQEPHLYSLGWDRTSFRGNVLYTHSGGMHVYGAEVYWLPDIKYGVVALGNTAVTSNAVEEVLCWQLIQDKLGIPRDEQHDFGNRWREYIDMKETSVANAVDTLFPDLPDEPRPSSVDIAQLNGTYYDAGYGTMQFRVEPDPDNEGGEVLVADRPEMTWKYQVLLRHITGDYWIVWTSRPGYPNSITVDFAKAEFVFGVDGRASALKIDWSSHLVRNAEQGIITFDKVG